ncbi:hypothetical protein J8J27_35480, partial [Mycobacterium tuberculosis]|nr:hypothetical protein [Mycobacterium tuberculosis]
LVEAARAAGVAFRPPAAVTGLDLDGGPRLTLDGGDVVGAALVVAADGATSRLRGLAGLKTVGIDYDQAGIVVTVQH